MSKKTTLRTPSPPAPASEKTSPKPEGPPRNLNRTRQMKTAEQMAQALRMRIAGNTFLEISQHFGWANKSVAYNACMREMQRIKSEPATELRKIELERLDLLWRKATKVLEAFHPVLYQGEIVKDPMNDQRLEDQGPALDAIHRLLSVMERRAKLLGLDAPTKTALTDPTGEKAYEAVVIYVPANNRETT